MSRQPYYHTIFIFMVSALMSSTAWSDSGLTLCDIPQAKPTILSSTTNLNPLVLSLAFKAHDCAQQYGVPFTKQKITIIDYSLPSTEKRLWVVDLEKQQVLMNLLVAHGKNSGELYAREFSDRPGSLQTSIGLFLSSHVYEGHNGMSLVLKGLEPGYNDLASNRMVVVHGAWYVSPQFVAQHGFIGRSWGCPAVDKTYARQLITTIKDGSLLFSYYPKKSWLEDSKFLHCKLQLD